MVSRLRGSRIGSQNAKHTETRPMTDKQKITALERRLGFYERLTNHQREFIKQHDLASEFQVWLEHKIAVEGIST